jgi:Putative amidoligase enzyme
MSTGGLELVSPILYAVPGSNWRESVYAIWQQIQENCRITANQTCGTHIHVSLQSPDFSIEEVRRVMRAIIHFEPAFEVLVPWHRRGNYFTKSNWYDGPGTAWTGRDRAQSIAALDRVPDIPGLVAMMQTNEDKHFCWNFEYMLRDRDSIEFRQPPASTTPEEALSWAELVMTFIQASVVHGTAPNLQRYTSNLGGLKSFLKLVNIPGVNEPRRLELLWNNKPSESALHPISVYSQGRKEQREYARIEAQRVADKKNRVDRARKTAREA